MVNALSGSSKYVCVTLAWFNGNCGLRWLAGLKWDVQEFLQCPGKDFGVSGFWLRLFQDYQGSKSSF